jgi:hypothetical protein
MTRRLPNCAGCGKPLARAKTRTVMTFHAVVGIPTIGVCFGDPPEDQARCMRSVPPLHGPNKSALAPVLRMVAARGPGRVSLTYQPSLGREITLDEACADAERMDGRTA